MAEIPYGPYWQTWKHRRDSAEYRSWDNMRRRCYLTSSPKYKNYGARGITMCDRWRNSFEAFFADMGPKPSPWHSIDRINNDGNYEPENCRWATRMEQARNRSDTHMVVCNGKQMTRSELVESSGMPYSRVVKRLNAGWTPEDAVSAPSMMGIPLGSPIRDTAHDPEACATKLANALSRLAEAERERDALRAELALWRENDLKNCHARNLELGAEREAREQAEAALGRARELLTFWNGAASNFFSGRAPYGFVEARRDTDAFLAATPNTTKPTTEDPT